MIGLLKRKAKMNRKTSTLLSMAVSIVLIALGVGFIYNHTMDLWPANGLGHHGFMGGGMGIIMILFWILIIGALVLLVSAMVNAVRGARKDRNELGKPLDILKQRYARGEIDTAEYEKMRRELSV
jgi:putative membrane protein